MAKPVLRNQYPRQRIISDTTQQSQDLFSISKLLDPTDFAHSRLVQLATPISNGGLTLTPPGYFSGSARGGISQYHYFWLPSYVGLTTFFRPLVYHSLLVPKCICVLSLHSHFPLLKRNILLPRNVYPHIYFDTLGACQITSVYFYLLGMT